MKNARTRIVSETDIGLYVWQLPNGDFLSDDQVNVLSIEAVKGDIKAMANISMMAKHYGFGDGTPIFLEGHRKINDEELYEQIQRLKAGLTPDPYDIGVYKEEVRKLSGR